MSQIEPDTFIESSSEIDTSYKQECNYNDELYSLFESYQKVPSQPPRLLTKAEENILTIIANCFRTWYEPWKKTFLESGREFRVVYDLMEGLLHYEYQITNSNSVLSSSKTNAIEQAVIRLVDYGNAILNIDLVIRICDDSSNEMDPFNVTTIELYHAHLKANNLRKKLLYDYYFKRDKSNSIGGDSDISTTSSINNGLHAPLAGNLHVPNQTLLPSPTHDRCSLARTPIGSSTSINTIISDGGRKTPQSQIEVLLNNPSDLSANNQDFRQIEITHMIATIKSPTFSATHNSTTRLTLLPGILAKIESLLSVPTNAEKTINCFEILDALLDSVERLPVESRSNEVNMISLSLLKPIVRKVFIDDRDNSIEFQHAHWTTCLLSMIRLMTASDFNNYLRHFNRADLSAFLKDYLFIIKRIMSTSEQLGDSPTQQMDLEPISKQGPSYPDYWIEMKLLACSAFFTSLTHLYQILRQYFATNLQIWMIFIESLIHFILQGTLRSDRVMLKERQRLLADDLRQTAAEYIWISWDSLSLEQKQQLLEDLIEPLLRACIILNSRQRSILLPIFYDMMRCDYSSQYITSHPSSDGSGASTFQSIRRDYNDDYVQNFPQSSNRIIPDVTLKANESLPYLSCRPDSEDGTVLTKFTHLIVGKLNALMIDLNLGDECFKNELCDAISGQLNPKYYNRNSAPHSSDSSQFRSMAQHTSDLIAEFMQICLDSRQANKSSYKHIYLLCLFKLILFFKDKVDRPELYLNNLYKLCYLHHNTGKYIEAGFTLLEHAKTLSWSDAPLENHHRIVHKFFNTPDQLTDHSNLKIFLYNTIIEYFDRGQIWEMAVPLCRELVEYYEFQTYDYEKLANIMQKMSSYFSRIVDMSSRSNPEYFRITFYGCGFPRSFREVTMVYRGKPFEKLGDFQATMLEKYPDAKLLNSLAKPDDAVINEPDARYLQINACLPIVNLKTRFGVNLPKIEESILNYYRHNECDRFNFSRRIMPPAGQRDTKQVNQQISGDDFASMWRERTTLTTNTLPGMLPFFPVYLLEISIVSPIESAIEDLERANDRLSCMVNRFKADKRQVEDVRLLGQLLLGIVDAAVNGGIAKYEEAFFSSCLQRDSNQVLSSSLSANSNAAKQSASSNVESINHVIASLRISNDKDDGNSAGSNDASDVHDKGQPSVAQVDRLKHLIAQQVPLLDEAIRLHRDRVADVMRPQHEHLEISYKKLKQHIMTKYSRYLPADYSSRSTMRSYRSLARSPNRSIRSESRLPFTSYTPGGSARFANKRMSDAGPKLTVEPSGLSYSSPSSATMMASPSAPTKSSSIPYKQLTDNDGPCVSVNERRSLPFLTGAPVLSIESNGSTSNGTATATSSQTQPNYSDALRPPIPAPRINLLKIDSSYVDADAYRQTNGLTSGIYAAVTNDHGYRSSQKKQMYARLIGDDRCFADDDNDDGKSSAVSSPDEENKRRDSEIKLVLL